MAEQSSQIVESTPEDAGGVWLPAWDGASYAANTGHHRVFDAAFLATLPLEGDERILDLCCGSGDFTRAIADRVPRGEVVGVDAQPSMIEQAQSCAAPNQRFALGAVQHLASLVPEAEGFDVVMSRSALHWVPASDHPPLLAECLRQLRPGGRLRLEFGGGDNVRAMLAVFDDCSAALGGPRCPWTYLGASYYLELLEGAGFSTADGWVRTVAQRRAFDRASLIGWLESQCFQAYEAALAPEHHPELRRRVLDRVDEMRRADGSYDQTFVRLDVLAHRP